MPGEAIPGFGRLTGRGFSGPGSPAGGTWLRGRRPRAGTAAGRLPGGGGWPAAVEPGGGYCARTRLDLADFGPGPALLMAWAVNR